jgi:hypothetical protein
MPRTPRTCRGARRARLHLEHPVAIIIAGIIIGALGLPAPAAESPTFARFETVDVEARRGEMVGVPFRVETDLPVSALCWSVEYDPVVFVFLEADLAGAAAELVEGRSREEWAFEHFAAAPGSHQFLFVIDREGRAEHSLPPGEPLDVARMWFRITEDAPEGTHTISFTRPEEASYESVFRRGEEPVYNAVSPHGQDLGELDGSEDIENHNLIDGLVRVSLIGEVGVFRRGDANLDREVDISDPVMTLHSLFFESPLPCVGVADTNVDGRIDLTDPLLVLGFLAGITSWRPLPFLGRDGAPGSCP